MRLWEAGGCKKGLKKKCWSSLFQDLDEEKSPSPPSNEESPKPRKKNHFSAFQNSDPETLTRKRKRKVFESAFQDDDNEQGNFSVNFRL